MTLRRVWLRCFVHLLAWFAPVMMFITVYGVLVQLSGGVVILPPTP